MRPVKRRAFYLLVALWTLTAVLLLKSRRQEEKEVKLTEDDYYDSYDEDTDEEDDDDDDAEADENVVEDLAEMVQNKETGGNNLPILRERKPAWDGKYPHISDDNVFLPMQRLVHIDLKGAPMRPEHYGEFFRVIKWLGATGILIEWEDMFPYEGELSEAVSSNAYTKTQVVDILEKAKRQELQVISLVQTLGHMEWLLKLKQYAELREIYESPQVVCPLKTRVQRLIISMLEQVLSVQESVLPATHIHIGADEAYYVGKCSRCEKAVREEYDGKAGTLILKHVEFVAKKLKESRPEIRVLMWHDMLRGVDDHIILQSDIGKLVEPVMWGYGTAHDMGLRFPPHVWDWFSRHFDTVWAASAYRGAVGTNQWRTNTSLYVENHLSWLNQMTQAYGRFRSGIPGIFLTGWARYDHFTPLCELLPESMSSLGISLQILHTGHNDDDAWTHAQHMLGCKDQTNQCGYPGSNISVALGELKEIYRRLHSNDILQAYFSPGSPYLPYTEKLNEAKKAMETMRSDIRGVRRKLVQALSALFFDDAVTEFLAEAVDPVESAINDMYERVYAVRTRESWPRRPAGEEGRSGEENGDIAKSEGVLVKGSQESERNVVKASQESERNVVKASQESERNVVKASQESERNVVKASQESERNVVKASQESERNVVKASQESERNEVKEQVPKPIRVEESEDTEYESEKSTEDEEAASEKDQKDQPDSRGQSEEESFKSSMELMEDSLDEDVEESEEGSIEQAEKGDTYPVEPEEVYKRRGRKEET